MTFTQTRILMLQTGILGLDLTGHFIYLYIILCDVYIKFSMHLTGHLHDGVILLPRPERFVKMLSYSNLSSLLGIKRQLEKMSLTIKATNSILVLVVQ